MSAEAFENVCTDLMSYFYRRSDAIAETSEVKTTVKLKESHAASAGVSKQEVASQAFRL